MLIQIFFPLTFCGQTLHIRVSKGEVHEMQARRTDFSCFQTP